MQLSVLLQRRNAFFTGNNKQSPSISSLKKHLNDCHFGLYDQINFVHPTVGFLFDNDQSKLEEIFVMRDERKQTLLPPKVVKTIQPPKGKLTQECSEVIIDVDQDDSEERNRRVFKRCLGKLVPVYKRIYRNVLLSVPIAWNTNDMNNQLKYFASEILAWYYEFSKYSPEIISELVAARQCLFQGISSYAFACDGWSTLRHGVILEAFFVSFFHRGLFRSVLLDAYPMEKTTSQDIQVAFNHVCNTFHLSPDHYITTDSAANIISAFNEKRIKSNAF